MIKRLSLDQIDGLNFVPVAAIAVPSERFRDLGYAFDRDTDDLDRHEFAAFEIAGRAYSAVAEEFGLPGSTFHWRWNGQPVSLATFSH